MTLGDVGMAPAVDRLSRDTTDLPVIARELEKAGAGLRSIAETLIDTTSDFKEIQKQLARRWRFREEFSLAGDFFERPCRT